MRLSILPDQLKSLCDDCTSTFDAIKSNELRRNTTELINKNFRRSLYFVNAWSKGEVISKDDIRRVRPGFGLAPKYFDWVVGQKVSEDVEFGDPVILDVLTNK